MVRDVGACPCVFLTVLGLRVSTVLGVTYAYGKEGALIYNDETRHCRGAPGVPSGYDIET